MRERECDVGCGELEESHSPAQVDVVRERERRAGKFR